MLRYQIYQSFETLPIWNWNKVQTQHDLRYLLILKQYDKLPRLYKYLERDLVRHYSDLLKTYKSGKNRLLESKKNVVLLLIELVKDIAQNSKDPNKIAMASAVLRSLMINPENSKMLFDVNFTETPDQRSKLTFISLAIKKYIRQLKQARKESKNDIYDQAAIIESELGVHIDVKKTSVKMYKAYVKRLNNKISDLKNARSN